MLSLSDIKRINYFKLDLSTLNVGRIYRLKLKIVEAGISTIIDDKTKFEIVD